MVESTPDKAALLCKQFFPRPANNTIDKPQDYPRDNSDELAWGMSVGVDMVSSIILSLPSGKAPGPSGITNSFLKMLGRPLMKAIAALTEGCWQWEYYPSTFKLVWTVALHKSGKPDYSLPKVWWPIALLNTVGKIIKAVTVKTIQQMAEECGMLPAQQMGACWG